MLKIRLMRIGTKKRPFYRVVVVDERNKRNGAYIEAVGTYNPLTQPKEIKLKQDRIDHWLKMGAQKSDGFLRILKEAPHKSPRKPKKQQEERNKQQEAKKAAEQEVIQEIPAEPTLEEEVIVEAAESQPEVQNEDQEGSETANSEPQNNDEEQTDKKEGNE